MKHLLIILCLCICVTTVNGAKFGSENTAASGITCEDIIVGHKAQCPSAGIGDSIYAYLAVTGAAHNVKAMIYEFELGEDTALVDSSAARSIAISEGWEAFALLGVSGKSLEANTWYILSIWAEATTGDCQVDFWISGADGQALEAATFNGCPATLTTVTFNANRITSIYCVFTPTVTGPPQQRHGGVHHSLIGPTNIH